MRGCAEFISGSYDGRNPQTSHPGGNWNWILYTKCNEENEAALEEREERVAALNAELDVARDELRRVQIAGCS